MQIISPLTERGTITIPASIRKQMGLQGAQQMIIETTADGKIILQPAAVFPIEIYTEERIAEFFEGDEELGQFLDSKGIK